MRMFKKILSILLVAVFASISALCCVSSYAAETVREKAIRAYNNYLSNNNWIEDYSNSGSKQMAVFDLGKDSIPEVCAYFENSGAYTIVILSYEDKLNVSRTVVKGNSSGEIVSHVNEKEGTYFTGRTRGKNICTLYRLDEEGKPVELFSCFPGYFGTEGYDDEERDYNSNMAGMREVEYVPISPENIEKYFPISSIDTTTVDEIKTTENSVKETTESTEKITTEDIRTTENFITSSVSEISSYSFDESESQTTDIKKGNNYSKTAMILSFIGLAIFIAIVVIVMRNDEH